MAHHLVAQKFRILVLQAKAVVLLLLAPVLQFDHHVDGLGILHALHAKQGFHIDDPDAAQLDKVLGDVRSAADQSVVADLADLHHVVGDQTVAALDQLQGRLALADAALAHDQHALAEHVDEHAVNADAGGQLDV